MSDIEAPRRAPEPRATASRRSSRDLPRREPRGTPVSVVIPAHDEEDVIARNLAAVLDGAAEGELDVVVVCNGCSDRTAERARSVSPHVRVIETSVASKTHALNLGDRAARGFPRFYVDADVVLPLASIRNMARRLREGALAAAPSMQVDLTGSSWPVRAFYAVWTRLPYVSEGMIGVGVYALSSEGRRRFDRFPDVVADDGFVRSMFADGERVRVHDARVVVVAPATLGDLLRVKTRSRLGGYQLARRHPELLARERAAKDYRGAMLAIAARPWLWPHAAVYLFVNLASRRAARRRLAAGTVRTWDRDASSRRRPSPARA